MTVSPSVLSERGRAIYGPTPPGRRSRASGRRLSMWTSARPSSSSSRADARGATASCCPWSCRRATGSPSRRSRSTSTSARLGTHRLEDRRRERGGPARGGTAERVARSHLPVDGAHEPGEPRARALHQLPQRRVRVRVPPPHGLPPARCRAYSEDEVAEAIECLLPTLEIGDTVFEDWYSASSYLRLVPRQRRWRGARVRRADRGLARARSPQRAHRDQPERAEHQRGLRARGDGAPADVADLARNWLSARGRGLEAGEIVSTGTLHRTLLLRARRQRVGRLRPARRPDRALRVMTVAVGVIGLGAMGRPMAEALATRGLPPVVVRDLGDPALAALAAAGARRAASVAALASEVDVVVLSLPDAAAVESVTLEPRASRPVAVRASSSSTPRRSSPGARARWRPSSPAVTWRISTRPCRAARSRRLQAACP